MMTNDHQQSVRREVVGASRNLRRRNMQGAFQSANVKLSRLPDIENRTLLPALRMSASSRTEMASEPLRGSMDITRCSPDLHYVRTHVGPEAGQETLPR